MGGMRWWAESVGGMAVQVVPASYYLLRSPSGAAAVLQVSGQRGQLANLHEHLSELEVRRGLFPPLRSRRVGMSGTAPPHCARESLSLRASACVLACQLLVQCSCARARSTCHRTAYHTHAPSCVPEYSFSLSRHLAGAHDHGAGRAAERARLARRTEGPRLVRRAVREQPALPMLQSMRR